MPECGVFGSLRPRGFSFCCFQTVDILLNCSVKVRSFCDRHTTKRPRRQFRKELVSILRRLLLYISGAQKASSNDGCDVFCFYFVLLLQVAQVAPKPLEWLVQLLSVLKGCFSCSCLGR